MPNRDRKPVNQSAPATRQDRLHVQQSRTSVNHLKTPAGTRRKPVNQSHLNK
jgi:hypothetical protein